MTMSKAALDRCRSLKITIESNEPYLVKLEVFDPQLKKVVRDYQSRTAHDTERVKRSFMQQFRIPIQKVTWVELKPEPKLEPSDNSLDLPPKANGVK